MAKKMIATIPAGPVDNRWTYYRLSARAMASQERSIALEVNYMRRHYPGFLSQENVAESITRSR
jgi:hypothetical protein